MATATDASVTVIVPTFEQPILLARALTSLRDQTNASVHVLVVNNGGDPAPVDQVVRVITSSSSSLANAITVRHLSDRTVRGALLRDAFTDVVTPYVAILDESQTWQPTCAAMVVRYLKENTTASAVCVGYAIAQEKMIEERVWPRLNKATQISDGDVSLTSLLSGIDLPEHAFVYRCDAITNAGGINSSLEYVATWDLNVRIASGGSIGVIPTPLATLHVLERTTDDDNEHRSNVEAERHHLVTLWLNEVLPGGANKGQCALDALAHRNRETELEQLRTENAALRKEIASFHGLSSRALRAALQPTKLLRAVQRRTKK
jgi:hypothetical protein